MLEYPTIPDKEFFSIGEVSNVVQVPAYVLRYWESEFRLLRPSRRTSGQRKYIRNDIDLIFKIKDLLYSKKFTISGAKKFLLEEKRKKTPDTDVQLNFEIKGASQETMPQFDTTALKEVKHELEEVLKLLKNT